MAKKTFDGGSHNRARLQIRCKMLPKSEIIINHRLLFSVVKKLSVKSNEPMNVQGKALQAYKSIKFQLENKSDPLTIEYG